MIMGAYLTGLLSGAIMVGIVFVLTGIFRK